MGIIDVDMELVKREYLEAGLSITAIANKYGYSVNTLRRRLQAAAIPVFKERQFGGRKGTGFYPQLANKDWLAKELETKPGLQIAEELGTTSGNVSDFIKRHGLNERDRTEAISVGIKKRAERREPRNGDKAPNWNGGAFLQNGYRRIYVPEWHTADERGYMLEHRYIMEQHLDRALEADEVVHHINYDKLDNRLENLQLLEDQEAHMQLHNTVRSMSARVKKLKLKNEALEQENERLKASIAELERSQQA